MPVRQVWMRRRMSTVARMIFRYDGDATTEETVHDLDALDSKLVPGSIIDRRGRSWKVTEIDVQRPQDEIAEDPVWRVYLSSSL
jgi:hypothetical protein